MGSDNLGSKKINNKQNTSEELDSENLSQKQKLSPEVEIDSNGNQKIVQRARNNDLTKEDANSILANENLSEAQTQKMVENKDRNSDITPNRYPNSHPDNHEDRGNIKLDE
ncbi:MAG: hypothetical protein V4572_08260 [Bacteroidota bacterium]